MKFSEITDLIRRDLNLTNEVPEFDPKNGNEKAKFLFLLEAPGPKALKTGLISFDNPDPTAKNFCKQLEESKISKKDVAVWNVIPWYLGNESKS